MARATITLTDDYQQIASGAAIIYVKTAPQNVKLFLNDAAVDNNAMVRTPNPEDGFQQTEAVATFAKGEDIVLIVDGAL